MEKNKELDLVFPKNIRKHIFTKSVKTTTDGKYVLDYFFEDNGIVKDDYIEIININGNWAMYPFKNKYNSYTFNDDSELISNAIISELPKEMRMKIYVKNKEERSPRVIPELMRDMLSEATGSKVIKDNNVVKNVYMVLLSNDGKNSIVFDNKTNEYQFEFRFPVFSLPYDMVHKIGENSEDVDINYDVLYNQKEYPRDELSVEVRKSISDYLSKLDSPINVSNLPILEVVDKNKNEIVNVCFVSCPNIITFTNIYRAESISIDNDIPLESTYDNILDSALHNERPMIINNKNEIISNGVKHNISLEKK